MDIPYSSPDTSVKKCKISAKHTWKDGVKLTVYSVDSTST